MQNSAWMLFDMVMIGRQKPRILGPPEAHIYSFGTGITWNPLWDNVTHFERSVERMSPVPTPWLVHTNKRKDKPDFLVKVAFNPLKLISSEMKLKPGQTMNRDNSSSSSERILIQHSKYTEYVAKHRKLCVIATELFTGNRFLLKAGSKADLDPKLQIKNMRFVTEVLIPTPPRLNYPVSFSIETDIFTDGFAQLVREYNSSYTSKIEASDDEVVSDLRKHCITSIPVPFLESDEELWLSMSGTLANIPDKDKYPNDFIRFLQVRLGCSPNDSTPLNNSAPPFHLGILSPSVRSCPILFKPSTPRVKHPLDDSQLNECLYKMNRMLGCWHYKYEVKNDEAHWEHIRDRALCPVDQLEESFRRFIFIDLKTSSIIPTGDGNRPLAAAAAQETVMEQEEIRIKEKSTKRKSPKKTNDSSLNGEKDGKIDHDDDSDEVGNDVTKSVKGSKRKRSKNETHSQLASEPFQQLAEQVNQLSKAERERFLQLFQSRGT